MPHLVRVSSDSTKASSQASGEHKRILAEAETMDSQEDSEALKMTSNIYRQHKKVSFIEIYWQSR